MHIGIKNSFLIILILPSFYWTTLNAENSTSTPTSYLESGESPFLSKRIPGCPDLESFQRINNFESLSFGQLNRISCLCGPGHVEGEFESGEEEKEQYDDGAASITCIYGSTLADLEKTLDLAKKANKSIERIVLNHVEIGEDGKKIIDILMRSDISQLKHFEMKKCRGSILNMSEESNGTAKFMALEEVVIEECEMQEIPFSLLSRASNVKSLSLANNKIHAIRRVDLAACKQSLENLNLAGNLIANYGVEIDSLSQLEALKNLEIGEHNFASEQLLSEIGQLANLESLEMSQMDGMERAEQLSVFKDMAKLKRLILTGCNFKALNASVFAMLPALEWLDLRVNLIEKLESGCFAGLTNLRFLSLAGNFLRELPDNIWQDLPLLENLDLGWNDFRTLNNGSFMGMSSKFERLNLRNNEALKNIAPETFDELSGLRYLNLSTTLLGKVTNGMLTNLSKLKELDLSASNISSMESDAFEGFKASLEVLNLATNNLNHLEANLLNGMDSLRLLDLSENHWICDDRMQKVASWIDEAYKRSSIEKREFMLRHGLGTICDRPYSRRGESILDLIGVDPSELVYDERMDTTISTKEPLTTTVGGVGLFGEEENATINWQAITILVGSAGDEHVNFSALLEESRREDAKKPKYDINSVKYGQKSVTRKEANTWLSGVIVTLLVIVTAFCIIIVARRNKTNDNSGIEEEHDEKEEEVMRRRVELEKVVEQRAEDTPQQNQQQSLRLPKTDTDLERNCATTTF